MSTGSRAPAFSISRLHARAFCSGDRGPLALTPSLFPAANRPRASRLLIAVISLVLTADPHWRPPVAAACSNAYTPKWAPGRDGTEDLRREPPDVRLPTANDWR